MKKGYQAKKKEDLQKVSKYIPKSEMVPEKAPSDSMFKLGKALMKKKKKKKYSE
jgi:hypothetical protein